MLKRPRRRGVSAVRTQAGSAQTGLHGGYLAQLDRLATADLAEPEIQGRIAELLTADYEAEVAARREAKATALQEVYRGLRDGDDRPASLPPDLAVLLSEAERAEIEAWWQGGLAGAAPVVGRLARLGKIGLRAAWDVARGIRTRRAARTIRDREVGRDVRRADDNNARRALETARRRSRSRRGVPAGATSRIDTPNGVTARLDVSGQSVQHIQRLRRASEDVTAENAVAVSHLIDGGRLNTAKGARGHIVNVEHGGGRAAAEVAFHRAIADAGGRSNEIRPHPKSGVYWRSSDGTEYRFYDSPDNDDTVLAVIPSLRAPTSLEDGRSRKVWEFKVRFPEQ